MTLSYAKQAKKLEPFLIPIIQRTTKSISSGASVSGGSVTGLDSDFVVVNATSNLDNERVLTAGDGVDLADGGAGSTLTVAVDVTDFIDTNYGLTESSNNIQISLEASGGLDFNGGALGVDVTDFIDTSYGLTESSNNIQISLQASGGLDFYTGTLGVDVTDFIDTNYGLTESSNNIQISLQASGGLDFYSGALGVDVTDFIGNGLTESSNDIILGTPSTLTVATSNAVTSTSHTHAITSSSNPGATASILASDSDGFLELEGLGVDATPTSGYAITTGTGIVYFGDDARFGYSTSIYGSLAADSSGYLQIDTTGDEIHILSANTLGADNFVSQTTGWQVTYAGNADFRNIYADELRVLAFTADVAQSLVGSIIVTKSRAILSQDFTIPKADAITDVDGDISAASVVDIDGDISAANITAVNTSTEVFSISGDQTSYIANGQKFTVAGSTGNDGVWIVASAVYSSPNTNITVTGDITDATVDGNITFHHWFAISGDQTSYITAGEKFTVASSTGNDGVYTVTSASYSSPNTLIVVDEAIPVLTADGNITFHHFFVVAGDQTSYYPTDGYIRVNGSTSNDNYATGYQIESSSYTTETHIYVKPSYSVIPTLTADGYVGRGGYFYVEDLEEFADTAVFVAGDYVRLRVIDRSGGGLVVTDVWGEVTAYTDQTGGEQRWAFYSIDDGGMVGEVVYAGSLALDYGVETSGSQGVWEATVLDTAGSPYSQVKTWDGFPWNSGDWTANVRLGNLDGISGIGLEYGLWAGQGSANDDPQVILTDAQASLRNVDLTVHDGSNEVIVLDHSTPYLAIGATAPTAYLTGEGLWVGSDSGTYKFHLGDPSNNRLYYDGTNLYLQGAGTGNFLSASSAGLYMYSNSVNNLAVMADGTARFGPSTAENLYYDGSMKLRQASHVALQLDATYGLRIFDQNDNTVVSVDISGNADFQGTLTAAGGKVVVDDDAMTLTQLGYAIRYTQSSTEVGSLVVSSYLDTGLGDTAYNLNLFTGIIDDVTLTNPSFESTLSTGWTATVNDGAVERRTNYARTGTYGLYIYASNNPLGDEETLVSSNYSASPGDFAYCEFWYNQTHDDDNANTYVILEFLDSGSSVLDTSGWRIIEGGITDWTKGEVQFGPAPASTTYVRIKLYGLSSSTDWADAYLDDFSLRVGQSYSNVKLYYDAIDFTAGTATFSDDVVVGNALYIIDGNTILSEGANNSIRCTTNNGYIDIGPQSANWGHIQTDRANFYMNKGLSIATGLYVGNGIAPDDNDIHYDGNLKSIKNSTTYDVFGYYQWGTTTFNDYAGDSFSSQSPTLVDMSGQVASYPTSGVKAIYVRVSLRDSGATSTDCYIYAGASATSTAGVWFGCPPLNDRRSRGVMIIPTDSNGDFYLEIVASGSSTMDIWFSLIGILI